MGFAEELRLRISVWFARGAGRWRVWGWREWDGESASGCVMLKGIVIDDAAMLKRRTGR